MSYLFEPGTNGKTWVLFHGTGGSENDLIPLAKNIDPNANIISFRGRVNENGMLRFFKRISPGIFDLDSLIEETEYYLLKIQELATKHQLKLDDMIFLGYSNGANMIGSLLLHQNQLFTSAVLIRPMVPLREAPMYDLGKLRVLILSGKYDPIVPLPEITELKHMFVERHAEVNLHLISTGHQIDSSEILILKNWYNLQVLSV